MKVDRFSSWGRQGTDHEAAWPHAWRAEEVPAPALVMPPGPHLVPVLHGAVDLGDRAWLQLIHESGAGDTRGTSMSAGEPQRCKRLILHLVTPRPSLAALLPLPRPQFPLLQRTLHPQGSRDPGPWWQVSVPQRGAGGAGNSHSAVEPGGPPAMGRAEGKGARGQ